jgi:hypothetical protein
MPVAGSFAEAQEMIVPLCDFDPALRLSNLADILPPFGRPDDRPGYIEALRKAAPGVTLICVNGGRRRQSWSKNGIITSISSMASRRLSSTIFDDASVRQPRSVVENTAGVR